MSTQQAQPSQAKQKSGGTPTSKNAPNPPRQPIPERDIKQNSGVSANMALQAMQKAWELRQAANAAGDPDAREEILAKAVNKEIEAESFGKAAKYTQSGTFQGLAAGAGVGVTPGVSLGKLTGALVGGVASTVTGLLGGGIGSVYGAMHGQIWDLGQMASQGVRGVVGDFPNWKSSPAQKRALDKMVNQTRETQAPSKEELEKMKNEAPDDMPQSWSQSTQDMTSYLPGMPSMPSMPNMSKGAGALGLGGIGASMGFGGSQEKAQTQPQKQAAKNQSPRPQASSRKSSTQTGQKLQQTSQSKKASTTSKPKPSPSTVTNPSTGENKDNKPTAATNGERKKPRKLAPKSNNTQPSQSAPRNPPRKLEIRKPAA
ncbi:hypothetical protein P280DRAFT_468264 [Massarina eburnea CBS 473.64]|uniref:Uncharacterized protein n=1 Tax=Massarina eburnea CBS 473.64 TaxID=1395130 RepID=A0A6A6S3N0_9PLEO|nr:hypothetical protein P280DRAFT_468264 [Massarina eburnea CBS 473.64]